MIKLSILRNGVRNSKTSSFVQVGSCKDREEKKKEENQTLFISFLDLPLVTGGHEDGHNNHKTSVGCV